MKIGIIYKYTSLSGKVYIGQTTDEVGRKWDHANQTIKCQSKFSNAIKKYGLDNFTYDVLYKTIITDDLQKLKRVLDAIENAYINYYDSYFNGYNCTLGGDGHLGFKVSEETKQKISKANTGKKRTKEQCLKISSALTGKRCKPVLQYTKDGILIKEWNSIKEAGETLNITRGNISKCCQGKAKTTAKYIWKYKEIMNNE